METQKGAYLRLQPLEKGTVGGSMLVWESVKSQEVWGLHIVPTLEIRAYWVATRKSYHPSPLYGIKQPDSKGWEGGGMGGVGVGGRGVGKKGHQCGLSVRA